MLNLSIYDLFLRNLLFFVDAEAETEKINSLADKSKNKTSRLHYSKFAKSKDLSLRSSTDIDLILGRHKRGKAKKSKGSDSDETPSAQKIDRDNESGKY